MRVYDLYLLEAVEPLYDVVSRCMSIVEESLKVYEQRIGKYKFAHWSDDPDLLYRLLENRSQDEIFSWIMIPPGHGDPVDWYIHSAAIKEDGSVGIHLDYTSMDENFGPKTFVKSVKKTICHETIHLNQRKIMGEYLFDSIKSGYQRGIKLVEKTGNTQDLYDNYFSDPTEIMAHGHDLAFEILHDTKSSNISDLPTLHRHITHGFPLGHPVTEAVIAYSKLYVPRIKK